MVLVTGASSGIGAATARRFAMDGWQLLLNGRDRRCLEQTVSGTSALVLPADLAAPGGPRLLAQSALHATGRIDVLFAGAGIGWTGPFAAMPHTDIDRVLALDLNATLHLVREVLPSMIAAWPGQGGAARLGRGLRGRTGGSGALRRQGGPRRLRRCAAPGTARHGRGRDLRRARPRRPHPRGRSLRPRHPRPVSPGCVAREVWEAVRQDRDEAYAPTWRTLPARIRTLAPALYRRLLNLFG